MAISYLRTNRPVQQTQKTIDRLMQQNTLTTIAIKKTFITINPNNTNTSNIPQPPQNIKTTSK
jgi:hypothetical protein